MVKNRIAPAPTGKLHIGTARVALFNYLFAKQKRGVFVVRIEDTDRVRSRKEFEEDIVDNLRWLGLEWDEFYRQSERIPIYRKYLAKLIEEGRAFWCPHTREETQGKVHFCEDREQSEQKSKVKSQKSKVIRFKTIENKEIEFEDLVRGRVKFNTNEIGDFSVAKSVEEPLWILGVTVDDYEMGITHVIRGEDHIPNTPKQLLLQEALGFWVPAYAHLPLILGPDRKKLSKRHGAISISKLRDEGYLPEALLNMMAFLGWNPGDEREFFCKDDLIKEFSLERIKKGAAVFNKVRLDYLNRYYLKNLPVELIAKYAKTFFVKTYGKRMVRNFNFLKKIVTLEKERAKTLWELVESAGFFFQLHSYEPKLLKWKNQGKGEVVENLKISFQIIEKILPQEYNEEKIKSVLLSQASKEGGNRGYFLWPLRVALSGKKVSSGPFEIASVLGRKETLKRIRYAIQAISSM